VLDVPRAAVVALDGGELAGVVAVFEQFAEGRRGRGGDDYRGCGRGAALCGEAVGVLVMSQSAPWSRSRLVRLAASESASAAGLAGSLAGRPPGMVSGIVVPLLRWLAGGSR
jgi:hypothetical protein